MTYAGTPYSVLAGLSEAGSFVFGADGGASRESSSATAFVDAELLFSGSYNRTGVDLIISSEMGSVVIPEYFKGDYRSALMSPEGASLSGKVIEAMTARVQYAQADQIASAVAAVGNVAKISGSAVVTRNGVPVELKQGDRLLKGDVVQTGGDTTIAIRFVDDTVLGLASNARIVLDEMTYDPNGSSNSSLLSLVQGTITLVAGHTAKFGNMRVETPVATMGIRGTAIMVEIAADDGPTKFSVLKEPDGRTGAFQLYDKETGDLIRVVSDAALVTLVSPLGAGQPVSAVDQLKTLGDLQSEKLLVQQVFQIYFPNYSPDGRTGSSANPLANPSGGLAGQGIESGVPALVALASGVSIIPAIVMAQDTLIFPETPETPAVRAVAVANVVDVQASQGPVERNFSISDQVTVTLDGQVVGEPQGRYVSGSGTVTDVESSAPIPQGVDLDRLVHVDSATGIVTYDASQFAFLGVGESAIYTIAFDSQPGTSVVPETLMLTINGLNDRPTVEHPIADQRIKEGCRFEYVIPACVFADLDFTDTLTYRATLANGDPLPKWLTFDPVTLTFSGTPPRGEDCVIHIKVIATDEHNATAVDQFDLVIADGRQHHRFDGGEANGAMALHEHDLAAANISGDLPAGASNGASDDREHTSHKFEARESDSANCSEICSHGATPADDQSQTSSRKYASSSVSEHVSYDTSPTAVHSSGGDTRAHEPAYTSVLADLDSGMPESAGLRTNWSPMTFDDSSQTNGTHTHFVTTSHSVTFTWNNGFVNQRDVSGIDSFVFRSDLGRDAGSTVRSVSEVIQTGRSGGDDALHLSDLFHATESFDLFTAHGEQGATQLTSSMEIRVHQSDFHLV